MPLTHLLVAALAAAAGPGLSERGKLLFSDDFSSAKPGWAGKPGKWEIVDGAAKVSEIASDKHAAVRRHPLAYHDAVFEMSFRLDGARQIAISLNNKGGHVCRLMITPAGMILQRDKPKADADVKPSRLAELKTPVAAGEWHKVVLEVKGPRITAVLDGKQTVSAENAAVDVDKIDFGIPVSGQSAAIDNLNVYEIRK